MSAESLSLIAGTVLSLIFSYVPGAKGWYLQFNGQAKRLIMLTLISLSAGIVFGLSCLGWGSEFGITLSCNQAGMFGLVRQVVLAIIANLLRTRDGGIAAITGGLICLLLIPIAPAGLPIILSVFGVAVALFVVRTSEP